MFSSEKLVILLILFPEFKIFIDKFNNLYYLTAGIKRLHFLFSFVIFKYVFVLPFLYEEYHNSQKIDYKITDSKIFNQFIFETKCLLFFCRLFIFEEKINYRVIYIKTFISFLRLTNKEFLDSFIFNEFSDFETSFIEKSLFRVYDAKGLEVLYTLNLNTKSLSLFKNIKINPDFVSYDFKFIKETEKLNLLYNCTSNNDYQLEEFKKKNENLVEKICQVFNDILKQ